MSKMKQHTHHFISEMSQILDQLNRYTNSKYTIGLTSERDVHTTIIKFCLFELEKPIYLAYHHVSNTEIDKGNVDILELSIDKLINFRVKEDFYMAAITHFVKLASVQTQQKPIGWSMGYNLENKKDE